MERVTNRHDAGWGDGKGGALHRSAGGWRRTALTDIVVVVVIIVAIAVVASEELEGPRGTGGGGGPKGVLVAAAVAGKGAGKGGTREREHETSIDTSRGGLAASTAIARLESDAQRAGMDRETDGGVGTTRSSALGHVTSNAVAAACAGEAKFPPRECRRRRRRRDFAERPTPLGVRQMPRPFAGDLGASGLRLVHQIPSKLLVGMSNSMLT
ncbi:unnamed protein product [Lampetra fluviatilis]